jgi:hypothetical protein
MMQVGLLLLAGALLVQLGESFLFNPAMHAHMRNRGTQQTHGQQGQTQGEQGQTQGHAMQTMQCNANSETYETYTSQEQYLASVSDRAILPSGFSVGTSRFTFSPTEVTDKSLPMNMTVILLDTPSPSYAAMFTSNQFPGAPIYVGREIVDRGAPLQAIVVNNKISNVCPGGLADGGRADCEAVCKGVESVFALEKGAVFPSSTGIIGWRLPVQTMLENIVSGGRCNRQKASFCILHPASCTLHPARTPQSTVYRLCPMSYVLCPMSYVLFPHPIYCPLTSAFSTLCPLSSAHCPLSSASHVCLVPVACCLHASPTRTSNLSSLLPPLYIHYIHYLFHYLFHYLLTS